MLKNKLIHILFLFYKIKRMKLHIKYKYFLEEKIWTFIAKKHKIIKNTMIIYF